jgi:5,10-methylenetetrahydromethanopterin reductase
MRFSCELLPEHPLANLIEVIVFADQLGFYACYSADETYHKDMWILFAAAAERTRRIRLGPEVTHAILRDPTMIAQQAATLDELTGGRVEVVFSIGNLGMLDQYHVRWRGTRPLARLREAHQVMRRFLDDGRIDFDGEFYRYTGLFTAAKPIQSRLPLKMGAMRGPGSFRLAGEIADGIHVACAHSAEALRYAADHVREGAARVERPLDEDFDFCASILGAIGPDAAAAKEAARVAAAFYISSMSPEVVERHGIPFDEVLPVIKAFGRGDVDGALALVSPEVGERLSLAGTPEEWITRISRDFRPHGYNHVAAGLADPYLVQSWSGQPIAGVPPLPEQLQLIHDEVLPAFPLNRPFGVVGDTLVMDWALASWEQFERAITEYRDKEYVGRSRTSGENAYLDLIRELADVPMAQRVSHVDSIVLFLNRWNCRLPTRTSETRLALQGWLGREQTALEALADATLFDSDLPTRRDEFDRLYASLVALRDSMNGPRIPTMGDAAASKILGVMVPPLFVMWDKEIKKGALGYGEFMVQMHEFAHHLRDHLAPADARDDIDGYLQHALGYKVRKPLAKYLDEYNWWVAWALGST